jgi:hypothetical protein
MFFFMRYGFRGAGQTQGRLWAGVFMGKASIGIKAGTMTERNSIKIQDGAPRLLCQTQYQMLTAGEVEHTCGGLTTAQAVRKLSARVRAVDRGREILC